MNCFAYNLTEEIVFFRLPAVLDVVLFVPSVVAVLPLDGVGRDPVLHDGGRVAQVPLAGVQAGRREVGCEGIVFNHNIKIFSTRRASISIGNCRGHHKKEKVNRLIINFCK